MPPMQRVAKPFLASGWLHHLVDERDDDAHAGGADGMAEGQRAAGQTALTAQQNGASPQQAFALSTMAGTVSYVTNKIPVNRLFEMMDRGAGSFVDGLKRYATQIGLNGAQSYISSYANTISDTLIMQNKSMLSRLIKQYEDTEGLSHDDASRKAIVELYVTQPLKEAGIGAATAALISAPAAFHMNGNSTAETKSQYLEQFERINREKPAPQSLHEEILSDWNKPDEPANPLKWPIPKRTYLN